MPAHTTRSKQQRNIRRDLRRMFLRETGEFPGNRFVTRRLKLQQRRKKAGLFRDSRMKSDGNENACNRKTPKDRQKSDFAIVSK
jgi:hypothetical protein